ARIEGPDTAPPSAQARPAVCWALPPSGSATATPHRGYGSASGGGGWAEAPESASPELPRWPKRRSGASASGRRSSRCARANPGSKHGPIISPHTLEPGTLERSVSKLLGKLLGAHLLKELRGRAQVS